MALVKGYHSYDRVKKDFPNINIYPTSNSLEILTAVSTKKADLTYGIKDVLEYSINKNLLSNLKITSNSRPQPPSGGCELKRQCLCVVFRR